MRRHYRPVFFPAADYVTPLAKKPVQIRTDDDIRKRSSEAVQFSQWCGVAPGERRRMPEFRGLGSGRQGRPCGVVRLACMQILLRYV